MITKLRRVQRSFVILGRGEVDYCLLCVCEKKIYEIESETNDDDNDYHETKARTEEFAIWGGGPEDFRHKDSRKNKEQALSVIYIYV